MKYKRAAEVVLLSVLGFNACHFAPLGGDAVRGIYFLDENIGWVKKTHSHMPMSKRMPYFTYLQTRDGGRTWKEISTGWILRKFRNGTHFINETKGWSVEGGFDDQAVVFHTTNGGDTWEPYRMEHETGGFRAVQFVNENIGWLVGTAIYKTLNAGKTWEKKATELSGRLDVSGICFLDENSGWICGSYYDEVKSRGVVLHTRDGGESWSTQFQDEHAFIVRDVFFLNQALGWIISGSDGKIFSTEDGGTNWQLVYDHGPEHCINSLHFVDNLVGWALGTCGPAIFKTTNGGRSWTRQF